VLWPVIHQWLGVSPDLGRGRVAVVPQLPTGQPKASANSVKLRALTSTWLLSTKARLDNYSDPEALFLGKRRRTRRTQARRRTLSGFGRDGRFQPTGGLHRLRLDRRTVECADAIVAPSGSTVPMRKSTRPCLSLLLTAGERFADARAASSQSMRAPRKIT